jgi:hypothetical protein
MKGASDILESAKLFNKSIETRYGGFLLDSIDIIFSSSGICIASKYHTSRFPKRLCKSELADAFFLVQEKAPSSENLHFKEFRGLMFTEDHAPKLPVSENSPSSFHVSWFSEGQINTAFSNNHFPEELVRIAIDSENQKSVIGRDLLGTIQRMPSRISDLELEALSIKFGLNRPKPDFDGLVWQGFIYGNMGQKLNILVLSGCKTRLSLDDISDLFMRRFSVQNFEAYQNGGMSFLGEDVFCKGNFFQSGRGEIIFIYHDSRQKFDPPGIFEQVGAIFKNS